MLNNFIFSYMKIKIDGFDFNLLLNPLETINKKDIKY